MTQREFIQRDEDRFWNLPHPTLEVNMAIDWDKPIQTRDGDSARLLGTVRSATGSPYVVAVCIAGDHEHVMNVGGDGRWLADESQPTIVNVPEQPNPPLLDELKKLHDKLIEEVVRLDLIIAASQPNPPIKTDGNWSEL